MPTIKRADLDKHVVGNMPGEDPRTFEAFIEDPYGAGAALVLMRGLPLSQITAEEACRFKLAFLNAFLALAPSAMDLLLEARAQQIADGSGTATPEACTDRRDGRPRDLPAWTPDTVIED